MGVRLFITGLLYMQVLAFLTAQNVGINTNAPTAPLHIVRDAPAPGSKMDNVMAILESNEESYIQLSNPENAATGILSGDRWTPIRSSLIFAGDSSILFKSGGDISRMIVNKNGRVGINTMSPLAQFHVRDSNVLFSGTYPLPATPSDPPTSGSGVRMMWYPDKAAFRSGQVNFTNWNKENIGLYSVGCGHDVKATGHGAAAFGAYGDATGLASTVLGSSGQAIGDFSLAHNWTIAKSLASFVIGSYNDTTSASSVQWSWNDPLFIIGNGASHYTRNNAFTVLKNAKTGINTAHPQSMLHVVRNGLSSGPYDPTAIVTFESNSNSYIHLKHPTAVETGILSGNEASTIRSGMIFTVDSSLLFRTGGNATRIKLDKSGKLGINTIAPRSLLHIRQGGNSGGTSHWQALATLESSYSGFLQFSQANNAEGGILSGNAVTDIRSCLVFGVDSSMMLRTGGNYNRMFISSAGRVGIATTTPQALLHLKVGSSGGGVIHPFASGIIERNSNSVLQFLTPANGWAGIISTDPTSQARSGIYFMADASMELRTGGHNYPAIRIDENGKTGIGTGAPAAKLDVNGTFKLGADGTSLNRISEKYLPLDLPTISAGTSYTASFSIPNIGIGGSAHVSPANDLPDGIIIAYTRCTVNNVHVKFTNVSGSNINPPNTYFWITVIQ